MPYVPAPVSAESLREDVLNICALGNRYTGSAGEREARALIVEEFQKSGLEDVRLEELTVVGYRPEIASCSVDGVDFEATGLQFTASAEVEAEGVYIGAPQSVGDIQALEGTVGSLAGKIAVLHTAVPFLLAPSLAERGACGIVVISSNWGGEIGHFTAQGYPPPDPQESDWPHLGVPGVAIEARHGLWLLTLIAAGRRRVRVVHGASYVPVETANVVGEITGCTVPGERIVVGAHYDTQFEGVGACDNATGLATLFQVARAWPSRSPCRTVTLVAFADEEHGFGGSTAYCRRHADSLNATIAMMNLDALGWAYPASRALLSDSAIRCFALEHASALGWKVQSDVDAARLPGSDIVPFIDAGVPAYAFWRYPPPHPHYHSAGDVVELIDFSQVAETASMATDTALRIAREPELRFGRSQPTMDVGLISTPTSR